MNEIQYAAMTHTTHTSDFSVGLTLISYNHQTYGSKNLNKLMSQNYKSLAFYE